MHPMMPHESYQWRQRESCTAANLLAVDDEQVRLFLRQFGRTQEVRHEQAIGIVVTLAGRVAPFVETGP